MYLFSEIILIFANEMAKNKLSHRITWHVILIMIIFNVLIIGAVIVFDLMFSGRASGMRAQNMMDVISGRLINMRRSVEIAAINSVAEIEKHIDSPEDVFDVLEYEQRLNKHYLGCGIGFEPNYFASEGRWFEAYVRFTDSTHVERKQIGSAQHDYLNMAWYQNGLAMERGQGVLSDPYFDEAGGKRLMCTYSSPVFDRQGRKVGVFGIDLNVGWIVKAIIQEEKKAKEIEFFGRDPSSYDANGNTFFIHIIDSKGKKIAGSETLEEETLQSILKRDSIGFERMTVNGQTYFVSSKRMKATGWTLVVAQRRAFVLFHGYILSIAILVLMTIGGFVIFFFTIRSIRHAVKPLHFLSDSAQKVAQGQFDTQLPTFKHEDEISLLRDSFDTMQKSLKQYMEDLKISTAAKASLESELNVAREIQMSMVPRRFPKREGLDLYAEMAPAKQVGGDLYGYALKRDQLYFCVGDVSGKGVPASLFMSQTARLFQTFAKEGFAPADIAVRMNNELSENNDRCMFVTMFIGLVNLSTGRLDFCNCGHNPPVVDGAYLQMAHKNKPLGLIGGIPYQGESIDDIRGRQLLIYTDGLNEAENQTGKQLGNDRLLELMGTAAPLTSKEVIKMLVEAVDQFRDGAEPNDDLTMMCIKI